MRLSERQVAAARRMGQDVCVVAGPGSGKTSVLIERFSWLVRERNVSPGRILAITFTEKAATEIRMRMLGAFEDLPQMRVQIERAWVSTIHSFCARLLRENAIEAGIDPEFTVLEQTRRMLQEVADEAIEESYARDAGALTRFLQSLAVGQDRDGYVPDLATSLVEIYQASRLAGTPVSALRAVLRDRQPDLSRLRQIAAEIARDRPAIRTDKQSDEHTRAVAWASDVQQLSTELTSAHFAVLTRDKFNKNCMVRGSAAHAYEDELRLLLKQLRCECAMEYYQRERELIIDLVERIGQIYRDRKRTLSALDFDDLEEAALALLRRDDALRQRIASGFDFILMDELQDTNPLQWQLMELVRSPDNFFAVGDINQSIYGFRHARPELFGNFRDGLRAANKFIDELRDNYRTRPAVLDVVNRLFEGVNGIEAHELQSKAEFVPKSQESVEVITAFGELTEETEEVEAQWIARRVLDLVANLRVGDRPAQFGDVAILTRANYSTAVLQHALDSFGIPAVVVGGVTFYDTREVRDLKLFLDVLVNPEDEIALAGVLRSPLFGLSDEQLFGYVLSSGSVSRGVRNSPPDGWDRIEQLRAVRNVLSPDRLLRQLLDECDYEALLTDRGRSNVNKFLAILREYYERQRCTLEETLEFVNHASPDAEAPPSESGNTVRLMTLHKSKGLEFPIVFIPFLHKGRNTQYPVISWSAEHGLGVKWRNPAGADNISDPVAQANEAESVAAQKEEENRLLYVGCTRAKEHLVLSWSVTKRQVKESWAQTVTAQLGLELPATGVETCSNGIRVCTVYEAPPKPFEAAASASTIVPSVCENATDSGSADSSATVTDVSQFSECPRKYFLGRSIGLAKAPNVNLLTAEPDESESEGPVSVTAGELGIQVHALLTGGDIAEATDAARELAARFSTMPIARKAAKAIVVQHEWDFVFETAGLVLRGQIDLWFDTGRELVIVDYKTDHSDEGAESGGYALQLQLYALALEKALRRSVSKAVLCFLRTGREVEVDVSPLATMNAIETIHRFRLAQASNRFPAVPGTRCASCEYAGQACPAGKHVIAAHGSPYLSTSA